MQKIYDAALCADSSPAGSVDGDRLFEGCGVHWVYCK